ncbi:ADP-glyceromanno-heptose 6-epimerase [Candidatus Woesearchaeota archaeon]|nr:ADP-glyceromanno-heptose 6-epimerase [Candidatus Woesearchaeota archaeon]
MDILLTGGAGFIGSNIALALQDSHTVTIIDNLSSGGSENLKGFQGGILDLDISEPLNLSQKFDAIIHEASITDTTFKPDEEMIRQNVEGFKNVLALAKKNKARLVYASSAGVYGNGPAPMKESQQLQPLNAYARSKAMIDHIAAEHSKNILIVGLRYFNVFGPREQGKGSSASMIYQLRKQILTGKAPRLFKFGEQVRDHIYVKDVAAATIKALEAKGSGVFNVGTGKGSSFNEVLAAVQETLGTNKQVEYFDNPITGVYQVNTLADTTLIARGLSWKPAYSLKEGIKDYFQWLESEGIP